MEDRIETEIIEHIRKYFGFTVYVVKKIKGGKRTKKWKCISNTGEQLFIKYYDKDYFSEAALMDIIISLQFQYDLSVSDFPCPKPIRLRDEYVHKTVSGYPFIIMEYTLGDIKNGNIETDEFYELGKLVGFMHNYSKKYSPVQTDYILIEEEKLSSLQWIKDKHKNNLEEINAEALETVDGIERILKRNDFMSCIVQNTQGWIHGDLWRGNILFDGDCVTSIVDFDRVNYNSLALDLARLIMSYAYSVEFGISRDLVDSLLEGYNHYHNLSRNEIVNAMKLLWYQETPWWLYYPKEFFQELYWIMENWELLEDKLYY